MSHPHRKRYKKISCFYEYKDPKFDEALSWVEEIANMDYFLDAFGFHHYGKAQIDWRLQKAYYRTDVYFKNPEDAVQFMLTYGNYTICPKD